MELGHDVQEPYVISATTTKTAPTKGIRVILHDLMVKIRSNWEYIIWVDQYVLAFSVEQCHLWMKWTWYHRHPLAQSVESASLAILWSSLPFRRHLRWFLYRNGGIFRRTQIHLPFTMPRYRSHSPVSAFGFFSFTIGRPLAKKSTMTAKISGFKSFSCFEMVIKSPPKNTPRTPSMRNFFELSVNVLDFMIHSFVLSFVFYFQMFHMDLFIFFQAFFTLTHHTTKTFILNHSRAASHSCNSIRSARFADRIAWWSVYGCARERARERFCMRIGVGQR